MFENMVTLLIVMNIKGTLLIHRLFQICCKAILVGCIAQIRLLHCITGLCDLVYEKVRVGLRSKILR